MSRIEKGILDKLINGKLLGKRKLGLTVQTHFEAPRSRLETLLHDKLYYPKTKLDRLIGNCLERVLPGFQFFVYNEEMRWVREAGYTLSEKFHHSFRHEPPVQWYALAQMVHPFGYLEHQRRDQSVRRIQTLMPGIEVPDWAHEYKRRPDFDMNATQVPFEAMRHVLRESTPSPHYEVPDFNAIHHVMNNMYNFGFWAQRLFYNEDLRGSFFNTGYISKSDKEIIHGWYADAQRDSQKDRIAAMSDEERADHYKQQERWNANFRKFFPEFYKDFRYHTINHKYEEPYYERNMQNIRSSIFTGKWNSALEKRAFNDDEIRDIYEFFLAGATEKFFTRENEDEEYQATPLYTKFCQELNFPNILSVDRFVSYTPEQQFYDLIDKHWAINFSTVDAYKRLFLQMSSKNTNSSLNAYILEEVYNPVFRLILKDQYSVEGSQTESFVLKAVEKGASVEDIQGLATKAQENTILTTGKTLNEMIESQVRKVAKSLTFKPRPKGSS